MVRAEEWLCRTEILGTATVFLHSPGLVICDNNLCRAGVSVQTDRTSEMPAVLLTLETDGWRLKKKGKTHCHECFAAAAKTSSITTPAGTGCKLQHAWHWLHHGTCLADHPLLATPRSTPSLRRKHRSCNGEEEKGCPIPIAEQIPIAENERLVPN